MKIGIELGSSNAGQPVRLDLEELLSTRLLVQGNSGSGKSHLLRRLLEQSAGHVQQAIIDPEGDFVGLAERYGHVVIDAERTAGEIGRIAARIRKHRASVVFNLEGLDADAQMRSAAAFLNGLFDADREYWFPMLVIVDEAQLFAPSGARRDLRRGAARVALGHDQPDVPRPQARAGRCHRHPAPRQACEERGGGGLQLPDGSHLPRHRHGARGRPARHGEAAGGEFS